MKTVSKKLLSLLLVAILLVSAIPFQALADACPDDNHQLSEWKATGDDKHYKVCLNPDCPQKGKIIVSEPHTYDGEDNECDETGCNWHCTHSKTEIRNKVDATCTSAGYTGDTYCSYCNMKVASGTATGLAAHDYSVEVSGTSIPATCTTAGKTASKKCSACDAVQEGTPTPLAAHTYVDGKCKFCQTPCPHTNTSVVPGSGKAATCVEDGYAEKKVCNDCGAEIAGQTIKATGIHDYDPANGNKCRNCPAVLTGDAYKLTLNANEGKIGTASSITLDVTQNNPIPDLPTPERAGFNFAGWFVNPDDNATRVNPGQTYTWQSNMTFIAKWTQKTELLTVRRVLNGDLSTAKTIYTADVPAGTKLLNYLNPTVTGLVNQELSRTPGYSWEDEFWRDYSGTQPLTSQNDRMDQAQTIYVNFVSNSYKLYFNADGGTVTPANKSVVYGSKVGTLPTPYKNGSVFMGWKDASNNIYTSETVYNVAGDTSLTAVWQDEALVILYIYINGDFSTCNRMIVMDGYVKNNNISRDDVFAEVAKYYTPATGTLKIAGLFDEYTWGSYRTNTSKAGTPNVEITAARPNKIYVMVSNASTGTTVIPTTPTTNPTVPANGFWVRDLNGNLIWYPAGSSLPAGSGYWILDANGNPNIWVITSGSIIPTYIYTGTNPKTGDTAQIEIAAAVMVLAAAALITIMALRKKKSV